MEINIKKLENQDIPRLLPLFKANQKGLAKFHVYSDIEPTKTVFASEILLEDFKKYLTEAEAYLAIQDTKILGLIALKKSGFENKIFGFNCASLDYFFIDSDESPEKTRTALTTKLKSWIKSNNIRFMVTRIGLENEKLINHLSEIGFQIIDKLITLRSKLSSTNAEPRVKIRPFIAKEIEQIGEISSDAFTHSRFIRDGNLEPEQVYQVYREWAINCCNGRSDEVLVAEIEGNVAGFITCNIESVENSEKKYGDIQLLAVSKDYRGKGAGSSLVLGAQAWFKQRGCEFVDVDTENSNDTSLAIYKKHGFTPTYSQTRMHKWI